MTSRDGFERLKAKYFYIFSKDQPNLGITLDYLDQKQKTSDIEFWPLVQSYALNGRQLSLQIVKFSVPLYKEKY